MSRVYNFSAGPAAMPVDVLQQAQQEMLDWQGSGMCVMEMSHRGKEFMSIASQAEADLRELLAIPSNYKVLFLQGGASLQFSAIPLNMLDDKTRAGYINTGAWSKKAISEANRYCEVEIVATTEDSNFSRAPSQDELNISPGLAYLHYVANETIGGVAFPYIPDVGDLPLVGDMSSTILSRPIDVSKYALIYAGAQKNIGPAGLTVVIVRDDIIGHAASDTPSVLDYKIMADNDSMYNTPSTYSLYMAGLVFQWLKKNGGLSAMAKTNQRKAQKLYAAIDDSSFYQNPVEINSRSWMNVPFTLADADLDGKFLDFAKQNGLVTLKGHRSVGGMRASIYNAMPESGIDALVSTMADFEKSHA